MGYEVCYSNVAGVYSTEEKAKQVAYELAKKHDREDGLDIPHNNPSELFVALMPEWWFDITKVELNQ
jgi:hypothetical protein